MAKLNKACRKIVTEILTIRIPHHAKIIKRKRENDQTLPNWFDKPVEWHETMLSACYQQIEDLLMGHSCYNGFREYERYGVTGLRWYHVDHLRQPDFRSNISIQNQKLEVAK